jgi:dihydroxyacetone kinase-like predicted kinase
MTIVASLAMSSPSTLAASDLRAAMITYGELLRSYRDVINRLNVYPVPDGDTGTNMALTIESVVTALSDLDENAPLGEVARPSQKAR